MSLVTVAAVAISGGFGALSRWGLGALVQRLTGWSAPAGTFVVNVTGCLLFGLAMAALGRREGLRPEVQLAILTGFMGAFTTFSTYMAETHHLLAASRYGAAAFYFLGQNALGFAALLGGMALGRGI